MTDGKDYPDYKILEYFDVDQMKVLYTLLKLTPIKDYVIVRAFEKLEEAKECVRMMRKYQKPNQKPIYHYVEN